MKWLPKPEGVSLRNTARFIRKFSAPQIEVKDPSVYEAQNGYGLRKQEDLLNVDYYKRKFDRLVQRRGWEFARKISQGGGR